MSTIITDNPYTFTVEDNMSIKAVFEDSNPKVNGYKRTGNNWTSSGNVDWTLSYAGSRIAHGSYSSAHEPTFTVDRMAPYDVEVGKYFSITTQGYYMYGSIKLKVYSGSALLGSGTSIQIPDAWGGKLLTLTVDYS
jgi:hypothetical protein